MKVLHKFSGKEAEKDLKGNFKMILTNRIGGFFSWQDNPESRYGGFYHRYDEKLFKSIESIKLHNASEIKKITNNFWNFEVERKDETKESFFIPYGFNTLVYETNKNVSFDLILDAKEMFDNDEWNRVYDFSEEDEKIIIKYTKSQDGEKKYSFFVVIYSDSFTYKIKKNWVLRDYKYDFKRKDPPFGRYVFSAMELEGFKFVFSVSEDKERAVSEAEIVFKNLDGLKKDHQKNINEFESQNSPEISNNEAGMAFLSAKFSLSNMLVHDQDGNIDGMYAGIPWFSQFWARDSLISLVSLSNSQKLELFLKYFEEFKNNKKIASCSTGCLESAGAHGLFFKRAEELISEDILAQDEIFEIKNILEEEIKRVLIHETREGFAVNGPKETWMDSEFQGDAREGIRIEMQALRLKMYNLAAKLTGERKYFELEHNLSKKVREYFFTGESLKDGIDDKSIRPNIFFAFYIYPELLFKHEWSKVFLNALDELWLPWGGLSSISKNSSLFCGEYRGCLSPDQSYHRGDSWYFLNNMAVIALKKTDVHKFKKNIESILSASINDILWSGALGHHSEVSSADKFSSFGCFAQSWSAALYTEALDEILKK